jgi:opacity protein-like surface antigen
MKSRIVTFLAASAALLLGTFSAHASDAARPFGCHASLGAGITATLAEIRDATSAIDLNGKGTLIRLGAGCDVTLADRIVAGGMADYAFGRSAISVTAGNVGDVTGFSAKVDGIWNLAARLGYKLGDSVMIYGKAGFAGAKASSGDVSKTLSGTVLGFGLEAALAQNIGLRLSYDHNLFRAVGDASATIKPTVGVTGLSVLYKF